LKGNINILLKTVQYVLSGRLPEVCEVSFYPVRS